MWLFVILSTLCFIGAKANPTCSVEPESNSTNIYKSHVLTVISTQNSSETVSLHLSSGSGEMIILDQNPIEVNSSSNVSTRVFFTSPGTYIIKAVCGNESEYTYSNSILVGELSLTPSTDKVKFMQPDNISSLFSFKLTFNDGLQTDTEYNCSLSLLDLDNEDLSNKLEGIKSVEADGDSCSFTSLRVINKGEYKLSTLISIHSSNQTGNTYQTYNTSTFNVTSKIVSIILDIPSSVDAYKDLTPSLTVKGNNDVDYLDGYSVFLTVSEDDSTLVTTGSLTNIEKTSVSLNFYFNTSGSITLTVNVTSADDNSDYAVENYSLTVNPAIFVLSKLSDLTSKDEFSIQIEIKTANNEGINSSKLGNFSLKLELKGTDNSGEKFYVDSTLCDAEYTTNSELSTITVSNVTVLSSGLFQFNVSSSDLFATSQLSNEFEITNYVKTFNYSSTRPSNYFGFQISFVVLGDDDELYLGQETIKIEEISDLGLNGALNINISKGKATASDLYFEKSGIAELNYTAGSIIAQEIFNVTQSLLEFDSIQYPQNSSTYFSVTVYIKNSNSTLEDSTYNHTVSLELEPKLNSSGTVLDGQAIITGTSPFSFTNLRVLSSGEFTIRAYSENFINISSDSFVTTNRVKSSTITASKNSPTAFENFDLNVTLTGEDEQEFLGFTLVELSKFDKINATKDTIMYQGSGPITFNVYSTNVGNYNFNVTVEDSSLQYLSGTAEIEVLEANIILDLKPIPTDSETNFTVKIEIQDDEGNILKNADGLNASLSINCSSSCVDPSFEDVKIIDGKGNSDVHRFLSSGNFDIIAKVDQCKEGSFKITGITNKVLSSELKMTSKDLVIYQVFNITVTLNGEDMQPFLGDTIVTLEHSNEIVLSDNNLTYSNGGPIIFSMYANATGDYFFTISTNSSASSYTSEGLTMSVASAIIKLSLDPTPTTSSTKFIIKAEILDKNQNVLENADNLEIILSINCTENISCIDPMPIENITIQNGKGQTNQHFMKSRGYFLIQASEDTLENDSILFGEVKNSASRIVFTVDPEEVLMFFNITANVTIYGEDEQIFDLLCDLTIVDNLGDKFADAQIEDGKETFIGYFNSDKVTNLTAYCNNYNQTIPITVNPLNLEISLSSTPNTSESEFQIFVSIQDESGNNINESFNGGVFDLQISLHNEDTLNSGLVLYNIDTSETLTDGAFTVSTKEGAYNSSRYKILSSGNFTFSVAGVDEYSNLNNATTAEFELFNELVKIELNLSDDQVGIFQSISINVKLTGADENPYLKKTVVAINETNSNITFDSCIAIKGGCFIEYTADTLGNYSVFAEADSVLSSNLPLKVGKWELKPENLVLPSDSSNFILAEFKVKDQYSGLDDSFGITDYCQVSISIYNALNQSGETINGTLSKLIQGGEVIFTDENFFLSSGNFQLLFYSNCSDILNNFTSPSFTVTNNVKNITIELNTDVTIYFNFTVEINIYGEDGNNYIGECNSSLKDDKDNIITTYYITNGYLNTSVYLKNPTATKLKTICAGFTGYSEEFTPKQLNFDFQMQNRTKDIITETDAKKTIYAIIRVVNDYWITEETNFNLGKYPFTLKLVNSTDFFSGLVVKYNGSNIKSTNGVFSGQTTGGVANISLEILSFGEFVLELDSDSGPSINSNSSNLSSINFFEKYSISINSTTIYLPTDFDITLYGSDENKFLLPMNATIIDTVNKNQPYFCENEKGTCSISNFLSEKTGEVVFNSSDLIADFSIEIKNIKINAEVNDISAIKTSYDTFNLNASLLDNNSLKLIEHATPSACISNLYIIASNSQKSSGEVLIADSLTASNSNGTSNFTSISILSSGKFNLAINSSCDYIDAWKSDFELTIYNYPKNMSLIYPKNVTVYTHFRVSTIITGDDDNEYLGQCNFTISENLKSPDLTEKYEENLTNLTIYIDQMENILGSIACTSYDIFVNESIEIKPFKQKLKIEFVGDSPSTSDPFDLNVVIQDKDGIILNSSNSFELDYDVNLVITNSSDNTDRSGQSFTGDFTQDIENFVAEFTDLQILSSGSFKIIANSSMYEFIEPDESEEFDIINLIGNFSCNFTGPQSTYFNFNLTIEATGEDSNPFLVDTNYTIYTDDNSLHGVLSSSDSTGKVSFKDLYFNTSGVNSVRISSKTSKSEMNGTCYHKIFKSVLSIKEIENPSTSDDYLSVIVNVVDYNDTENIEVHNGPYEVGLELLANDSVIKSSGNKLSGVNKLNSTSGSFNFTNLKVLSYGIFKVKATAKQNLTAVESEEFLVLNSIKTFIFSVDSSNTTFKDLSIDLYLLGVDDNPFIQDTNISIESNGTDIILHEKNEPLKDSSATFSLYSKRAENVSFSFTAKYAETNQTEIATIEFIPAVLKLINYFEPTHPNQSFFLEYSVYENLTSDVVLDYADKVKVNISFTCIPNSDLQNCTDFNYEGNDSLETSEGSVNFTDLKIMSISEFNVTAKALIVGIDNYTSGEYIVYTEPEFKMAFSKNPTNSSNEFNLDVFAYYGNLVPYKNIKFTITFSDVNDTNLSGKELILGSVNGLADYYTSNSSGYYTIKGIKILSSGYFKFNLYFENEFKLSLETGFVENFISNINLNCSNQVYINFPLIVNYNSTGDDKNRYKLSNTMSISDNDKYGLSGTLQNKNSEGLFNISLVKFETYSLKVITNTSKVFETCEVKALKNNLLLESSIDSVTYINNSELIEFTGIVYGGKEDDIENFNGKYTFTIDYTNSSFTSQLSLTSKAGAISESVHFIMPDSYRFNIKAHPQVSADFTRKFVIVETLEKISYNSSNLAHPVSTLILFPVQLYGYSGSLYKNETNVTLTCSEGLIIEEASYITNTGEVTFRIYSIEKGSYVCTINAIGYTVYESFIFSINSDSGIADQLCYIEYNPNDCYICIENSREDIEGNCTCADHSTYNISTGECICDEGYNSTNDFCILCGYFYEASEVIAYYSEFYDSILVEFGRKGNNEEINCAEAFTLPFSLANIVTGCEWVAEKSLSIYFNETVQGNVFDLIIDPLLIQRMSKGDCEYNVEELKIPVIRKFKKPTPVTTLFAPSEISASCGTEFAYIYTTTYDSSYKYDWSSDNSILNGLLSSESGTSVNINITLLLNDTYTVTLKVTNPIFKTSDSKSATFKVSSTKVISVGFTLGSTFNYKVSMALPLKASIINACGESEFSYSYTLLEDSNSNLELLERIKTNSPSLLNIRPGYFTVGKVYTITVLVESRNSVKGAGTLVINTISSDILITLSYSDGIISTLFDLDIVATVLDPDNPSNTEFTFKWTCTYNSGACKDKNGKNLINDDNSDSLSIDKSKLKDETDYLFKVSVSSPGKKTQSAQVELYASSLVKGLIRLAPINGVVNSNSVIILLPYIDLIKGEKNIEWKISPSIAGVDLNEEFLLIPKDTLESQQSYIITVYLGAKGSAESTKASSAISFTVNAPPICDGLSTEFLKPNVYLLTTSNCQETDSDSYILYQFGYLKNNKYSWLTRLIFEQTSTLRIPEVDKVVVRVCDSSLSCSIYESNISNGERYLSVNTTEYYDETSDFDMIPSSVAYYSEFIESLDDFYILFNDHKLYFNSIDIDDNAFDLFVTVHSILISNTLKSIKLHSDYAFEVVELIVNVTNTYGQSISSSNFEELVQIIGRFTGLLDAQDITNALNTISSFAMKEAVLDMYIENDYGNLKYMRKRLPGSDIYNSSLIASNLSVEFPDDLNIQENSVYDIILVKFLQSDGIFEVTLKETGSVAKGLSLYGTPEDQNINSTAGIKVEYFDNFDKNDDFECVYLDINNTWQEGGCEVTSISSDSIQLNLKHLTVFSIRSTGSGSGSECDTGAGPIATMTVIILLMIIAVIVFMILDKGIEKGPDVHRILLIYPLSSVYFKQAHNRRVVMAVQILTSQLVMLTFIGAFHNNWDKTNDETDNSFDNFYGKQLRSGAAGWILTQIFTIPVYFLNAYYMFQNYKIYKYTLSACGFFILMSFIGIIVMTTSYCKGWTEFWFANWIIFFFIDLLTLEVLYAFVMTLIIKPVINDISSEGQNDERNSKQISLENNLDEEIILTGRKPDNKIELLDLSIPEYDIIYQSFQ